MRRFEGKTIVVTGGNKGIGYAMTERFGGEGANLVIASIEEQVHEAAARLRDIGAKTLAVL
jgi:meso-butanediol dehydrogenase/(S,S)-butanediol dehydrogenase/diacetyl reductase